jgi:Cupin-like domain
MNVEMLGDVAGATAIPRPPALPVEWQSWVFGSMIAGVEDGTVAEILTREGFPPAVALEEIERIRSHPFVAAAARPVHHLRKLESLLAIKQALSMLDRRTERVERRAHVSRDEFLHEYYAANRPVVLTGLLDHSPAAERWTPEYIAEACGDVVVEVMSGRDDDPRYEIRSDTHRTTTTLPAYIEQILSGGLCNDSYLVANNHFFDRPETQVLLDEVPPIPEYLDPNKSSGSSVFLWFGPAGTITPLHHDVMNVLVAMVRGHKRFTLISPEQTPMLYNDVGVYSDIDPDSPDLDRFPLFRNVQTITVDVQSGDVLFLPVGWWHHVRSLDLSIMVSYTNFVFPNEFTWVNPWLG